MSFDITPIYLSFKLRLTKIVSGFLPAHPSDAVDGKGLIHHQLRCFTPERQRPVGELAIRENRRKLVLFSLWG